MSKIKLPNTSGLDTLRINDNFQKIEDELNEKVLYRDNPSGEPNEMHNDLDMNGKRIYNLPKPVNEHEPLRLKEVRDAISATENAKDATSKAIDAADNANDAADRADSSVEQMEEDFQDFLLSSGYQDLGEYTAGLEITARNQVFRKDGELYRASANLKLPYRTTGNWSTEGDLFVSVGDAALRQDLANPDMGASMLGRGVVAVDSIDELLGFPAGVLKSDLLYVVKGYHSGTSLGGGFFSYDPSSTDEVDGFITFSPSFGEGRLKRTNQDSYSIYDSGLIHSTSMDQSDRIESLLSGAKGKEIVGDPIVARFDRNITINGDVNLSGNGLVFLSDYMLSIQGSRSFIGTITTQVPKFSKRVIHSGGTVSKGTTVVLLNENPGSFQKSRDYYLDGEIGVFGTSISGQFDLVAPTRTAYPADGNCKAYAVETVSVKISDFTIYPVTSSYTNLAQLWIKDAKAPELINVDVTGGDYAALRIEGCLSSRLINCNGENRAPFSTTQYGLALLNCQDAKVEGGGFYGTRHGIATGGSNWVPNREINIVGVSIGSIESHGADFHGNISDSSYENCIINNGIYFGGKNITIKSCEIRQGISALPISTAELVGGTITVEDCDIYANGDPNGFIGSYDSRLATAPYERLTWRIKNIRLHLIGGGEYTRSLLYLLAPSTGMDVYIDGVKPINFTPSAAQCFRLVETADSEPVGDFIIENVSEYPGQSGWISFSSLLGAPVGKIKIPVVSRTATLNYTAGGMRASVNLPTHIVPYNTGVAPAILGYSGGNINGIVGLGSGYSNRYQVTVMATDSSGFSETGSFDVTALIGGDVQ